MGDRLFKGVYVGDDPLLFGETALLQFDLLRTQYLAQFDNFDLGAYCFDWHPFDMGDFEVEAEC